MKERLDKVLVDRGIVQSRERAKALIMEGAVLVDGMPVTKAGALINIASAVTIRKEDMPYVSRGGLKLDAAIRFFDVDIKDKIAMDVGSSTGGFADCMLQMGAKKVYCIDVGYGQIAWSLRNDPRVVLFERTNIKHLEREKIPEAVDIATVDVSFISLTKVMPKVVEFLKPRGEILALIKPQFEVGRESVGKGGIVREEEKRLEAVDFVRAFLENMGLRVSSVFKSPVPGHKGNIEYFIYIKKE